MKLRDYSLILLTVSMTLCVVAWGAATKLPYWQWALIASGQGIGLLGLLLAVLSDQEEPPVDIWAYQRELMRTSDQHLPEYPQVNNGTILYLALTLEELAETARAIRKAVMRQSVTRWSRAQLFTALDDADKELDAVANALKKILPGLSDFVVPLNRTDAKELFDGMIDVTVTVAGLPLASGFPAREGYREVQASNLSKRNPTTGVIDKHPNGKWIKGVDYREPNLGRVLDGQLPPVTDMLPREN